MKCGDDRNNKECCSLRDRCWCARFSLTLSGDWGLPSISFSVQIKTSTNSSTQASKWATLACILNQIKSHIISLNKYCLFIWHQAGPGTVALLWRRKAHQLLKKQLFCKCIFKDRLRPLMFRALLSLYPSVCQFRQAIVKNYCHSCS
jgi:hypothetical protein